MSRVFRRPMFRGGSTNMNGIMSGIQDRQNYAEGDAAKAYREFIQESPQAGIDPVAKLLISGGLRGLSETRGGSALANTALAFQEPTERLFSDLENRDTSERAAMEKALAFDLENERSTEDRLQALADIKSKQAHDEKLEQMKLDNKGKYLAKPGVIPSIITQQMEREKSYIDSGNLLLQQSPDFHARKTVNFERSAPPEVLKNYKGVVFYGYGRKGDVVKTIPPGAGQAGDIIYDPEQADFFIFDNQGNTYRYDPLTNQAED
tara:strand:+ start:2507 stop:3295 length:789 start_codon:yes stop_codon:yes gene_type:complete